MKRLPMHNGKFLSHTAMTDVEATAMEQEHIKNLKRSLTSRKQKATNTAKAAAAKTVELKDKVLHHVSEAEKGRTISFIRSHIGKAMKTYKAAKETAKEAKEAAALFCTPKAVEAADTAMDALEIMKLAINNGYKLASDENKDAIAVKNMVASLNAKFNHSH